MRPEDADAAFLWHMVNAGRLIQEMLAGYDEDSYRADRLVQSAVERQIEIIGEAARRVSASFREAHPGIPWRAIISQRNIIAHWYYGVDHARVWDAATAGVSDLIVALEPLLPPPPPDPEPG